MALYEFSFPSYNERDEVQAWIYAPQTTTPRGIVHIIHGLGEHSRRYLRAIVRLLDAGYVVAADDHVGHGATAAKSGLWQNSGSKGFQTFISDERSLHDAAVEKYPDLPYFVWGHSWGSMIAREYAAQFGDDLAGLVLEGTASRLPGLELFDRDDYVAELAEKDPDSDAPSELALGLFVGANDRFDPAEGPTAWVCSDEGVRADHLADPLDNFEAAMSNNFLNDFLKLYRQVNAEGYASRVRADLPILIVTGDQDPVTGFSRGSTELANALYTVNPKRDLRHLVYPGARHEVHNEPAYREDVQDQLVAFIESHR